MIDLKISLLIMTLNTNGQHTTSDRDCHTRWKTILYATYKKYYRLFGFSSDM